MDNLSIIILALVAAFFGWRHFRPKGAELRAKHEKAVDKVEDRVKRDIAVVNEQERAAGGKKPSDALNDMIDQGDLRP